MTQHIALIGTTTQQQLSTQAGLQMLGYAVCRLQRLSAWPPPTLPHPDAAPDLLVFHATDSSQLRNELTDPPSWVHQTPKLVVGLSKDDLSPAIVATLGPAGFVKNDINSTELASIIRQVIPCR